MSTMEENRRELVAAAALLHSHGYEHSAVLLEEIAAGKWTLVREPRYDATVTGLSTSPQDPR